MTDLEHGAELRERIDRAMTDLSAPEGLTEVTLTRGHRLRRRRRVVTAASGVAAAAVVAALVVPALDSGSTGTGPGIATDPPASPSATQRSVPVAPNGQTPSPGPGEPSGSFPEQPEGWWDMPSKQMATHLEELLPDGVSVVDVDTVMEDVAPGEEPVTTGTLHATLETEAGRGGFEILMYPPEPDVVPDPVTTTDAEGNEHTSVYPQGPSYQERTSCPGNLIRPDRCVEITGGGGVHVGRASATTTGGVTVREVVLHGPDDGLLYFATANSTDSKWGGGSTTSAAVPPLNLDQLRKLALDPVWTSHTP
jgi:hypothetical protein